MKNVMKKLLLFALAIGMLVSFTACEDDPTLDTLFVPSENVAEFTVWGMTCIKCVNKITAALSDIDGVIDVSVDLAKEKVTVEHEPDLDLSVIEKAITAEGFNIP